MSDEFSYDAPEDLANEGGNYLREEGTYHLVVSDIKNGKGSKGTPINGFTFEAECLAGTTEGCKGKHFSESLFKPDLSKGEKSQNMARKKLAAFFIATNIQDPSTLGKPCNIPLMDAVGAHLIIKLVHGEEKDEQGNYTKKSKFLQINYADIYHVDDPEVAAIPKDVDAINNMIENKAHRHDAAWFAFKDKQQAGQQSQQQRSTAGSFSDL